MQTYICATAKAVGEKFSGEPSAREGGRPVGAGSVTQALDQTLAMSRARPPGSAVGARASTHPVGPLCPRRRTYSSSILMITGFRCKKRTPRHKSWPCGPSFERASSSSTLSVDNEKNVKTQVVLAPFLLLAPSNPTTLRKAPSNRTLRSVVRFSNTAIADGASSTPVYPQLGIYSRPPL